jgi:hypothetical protein
LKTPNKIALFAAPIGLAAALLTATGAFAQSPAKHHPVAAPASVAATANAPTTSPAEPANAETADTTAQTAAEKAAEAKDTAAEATTANDAAGGHADNPSDPNADHQFNGEE